MPGPDAALAMAFPPMPAVTVAFDVVFGLFVVAFVVLAVITVTWAVRRDRAGRAEWSRRHQPDPVTDDGRVAPAMPNGNRPRGHRGSASERSD
ncbi:MAG: hypothetical protein ACYDHU_03615 [Acidimicrobiales bacterium]